MSAELNVLKIVSERLAAAGLDFMLTGSFALTFYATPRMTRELDFVVALRITDVETLADLFSPDFFVDAALVQAAITDQRLFNMMHYQSGIKIDVIVRKDAEYRLLEFARRVPFDLAGSTSWIVTKEDLILSKLVWAQAGASELQMRDVRTLLIEPLDREYLHTWAPQLGVATLPREILG